MIYKRIFLFSLVIDWLPKSTTSNVILSRSLFLDMLWSTSIQASPRKVLLLGSNSCEPIWGKLYSISLKGFISCTVSLLLYFPCPVFLSPEFLGLLYSLPLLPDDITSNSFSQVLFLATAAVVTGEMFCLSLLLDLMRWYFVKGEKYQSWWQNGQKRAGHACFLSPR